MKTEMFINSLDKIGISSFCGVPDSTLSTFCGYLNRGENKKITHYTTADEGAAMAYAVGAYLGDGTKSCVYMQNSGIGNIVNPYTSLVNEKIYSIPMLLLIGYRGEPGVKDEPQHLFMGEITTKILETLDIPYAVIDKNTTDEELDRIVQNVDERLKQEKQFAIIVKKGTYEKTEDFEYKNAYAMKREDAIACSLKNISRDSLIVSTTGKISREVYEQSDLQFGNHSNVFLTVGGMGYCDMIAYGLAHKLPNKQIVCFDGDGATLMHMGNLAFIGQNKPDNFIHLCFNNNSHESVGGMPTAGKALTFSKIAEKCGYEECFSVDNIQDLEKVLISINNKKGLFFVEICVAIGARENLGRPKESPVINRNNFMESAGK